MAQPKLCVDTQFKGQFDRLENLDECTNSDQQQFQLTGYKDLRPKKSHNCFDVPDVAAPRAPVLLYGCHKGMGNQMWNYYMVCK